MNRRHVLVAGAICWALFLVIAVLVGNGHAETIDRLGLLLWRDADLRPQGPPLLLESVRDMTALGGVLLRNLFALAGFVALLFLRLRREAVLLAATIASGWIVNSALKELVGRARPEIVPHLTEAGGMSFPSGHSFNSAAVCMALAIAFAALSNRRGVRLTIFGAAIATGIAVSASRVWLGVHFPSDAIAGWLGGTGWALIAAALFPPATDRVAEELPTPGT